MNAKVYELTKGMPSVEEVRRQKEEAAAQEKAEKLARWYAQGLTEVLKGVQSKWFAVLFGNLFLAIIALLVVTVVIYFSGNTHVLCLTGGLALGLIVAAVMLVLHALDELQKLERRQA